MKIAMIGHKRIPSREGGVEIVVEELATRLVNNGHQVDVYNRMGNNVQDKKADKNKKRLRQYKGVNIISIPTINKKGLDALIYSFLASIRALFGKYDVLHYHAEGCCAMLWIPHFFRKKIVVTIHGLDWQRSKWGGFATKYIKFGEKLAVKYADEIIVLSKGVQKYFKDTYNRDTHFIPNGVNKPIVREPRIIKEKYNLNEKDKNDYLEEIKKKASKDKRVIMTGFVQGQELEELFSNCYLYCLPSDVEGMPISLLEAMSYGCNCLVSDIEENVEVCGEYAKKFKKGNVDDLKLKLNKCLNEIENKNKSTEIEDYVLEKYDWDKVVEETKKIYKLEKK